MKLSETELTIGGVKLKGIYIAVVLSLATTIASAVWTASSLYSRLGIVEKKASAVKVAVEKVQLIELAINAVNSTNQIIAIKQKSFFQSQKKINMHTIALHEKFAIAIACIILFFIGAPLGALIKKGGIGLPIIIAISFFLTYHFIGIFAKNSADQDEQNFERMAQ